MTFVSTQEYPNERRFRRGMFGAMRKKALGEERERRAQELQEQLRTAEEVPDHVPDRAERRRKYEYRARDAEKGAILDLVDMAEHHEVRLSMLG